MSIEQWLKSTEEGQAKKKPADKLAK